MCEWYRAWVRCGCGLVPAYVYCVTTTICMEHTKNHIHTHKHACFHACTHTRTHTRTHTHTHTHITEDTQQNTHTQTHTHTTEHTQPYTHTHTTKHTRTRQNTHAHTRTQGLCWAVQNALDTYTHDREAFRQIQIRGMTRDASWDLAAQQYEQIMTWAATDPAYCKPF